MQRASPKSPATDFPFRRAIRAFALGGPMLVLALAMGGCATRPSIAPDSDGMVTPLPAELRERTDAVILRVAANSELQLDLGETLQGSSSEERTREGAKAAGKGGVSVALVGCHPQWGFLWVFTCPAGAVVGAGVAVAGSVGAGIYGGTTAWSREEIDAAHVVLNRSQQQMNLANELRDRLTHTLQGSASTTIIESGTDVTASTKPAPDITPPVVLAIDIDHFVASEVGEVSPDLWIDFKVSGGLYEFPDSQPLYRREWRLYTELGDYRDLMGAGGLGLRTKLDAAFEKMAHAIADDLLVNPDIPASSDADDLDGEVVAVHAFVPSNEAPDRSATLSAYLLYLAESDIADSGDLSARSIAVLQQHVSLKVGIFPAEFFNRSLPSVTRHELNATAALQKFVNASESLDLSYDYSAGSAGGNYEHHRIWTGSAIRKKPNPVQLQLAARRMDLDVIMMVWIQNGLANTTIDVYVYDAATGRLHESTGPVAQVETLIANAYSRSRPDQQVKCMPDVGCTYE